MNKLDWIFYINYYKDLINIINEEDAKEHWLNHGINENRFCNKKMLDIYNNFDWEFYLKLYNDLDRNIFNSKDDTFKHYCLKGHEEKRIYIKEDYFKSINFNWKFYIKLYSDLNNIDNKNKAYDHWLDHGRREDRLYDNNMYEKYLNFNWEEYKLLYPQIINKEIGFIHSIKNKINEINEISKNKIDKKNKLDLEIFDWKKYILFYNLIDFNKENAFLHWLNYGKINGYIFFIKNEIIKNDILLTFKYDFSIILIYNNFFDDLILNLKRINELYHNDKIEVIIINIYDNIKDNININQYSFNISHINNDDNNDNFNILFNKAISISHSDFIILHDSKIIHYENILLHINKNKLIDNCYLFNTIPYSFSKTYLNYFNEYSNNNDSDMNIDINIDIKNNDYIFIISRYNLDILEGFNETYINNYYGFKDLLKRSMNFINLINEKIFYFSISNTIFYNDKNIIIDEKTYNNIKNIPNYIKWNNFNNFNNLKKIEYKKIDRKMGIAISVYSDNYTPENRILASKICLNSIIKNFINNYIIIVIDNRITNNHYIFIKELIKNMSNVQLYINNENFGIAKTKNICIKLLEEKNVDYICLLDDDIEILDNFTSLVINIFDNINIPILTNYNHQLPYEKIKILDFDFIRTNNFFGNLLIINKEYIKKYGYFAKFEYKWGDEHVEITKRYFNNHIYKNIAVDLSNYINNEQIIDGLSMLHVHSINIDLEQANKNRLMMEELLLNIQYIDFEFDKKNIKKIII